MWVLFVMLQLNFYNQFVRGHPNCIVELRAFEKLKPYYVRKLKECNTCACKYHIEMVELGASFNNMSISMKGIHGSMCVSDCDVCCNDSPSHCVAERVQFSGVTNMWMSLMCSLKDFEI